jgi:hypothetical protein
MQRLAKNREKRDIRGKITAVEQVKEQAGTGKGTEKNRWTALECTPWLRRENYSRRKTM